MGDILEHKAVCFFPLTGTVFSDRICAVGDRAVGVGWALQLHKLCFFKSVLKLFFFYLR